MRRALAIGAAIGAVALATSQRMASAPPGDVTGGAPDAIGTPLATEREERSAQPGLDSTDAGDGAAVLTALAPTLAVEAEPDVRPPPAAATRTPPAARDAGRVASDAAIADIIERSRERRAERRARTRETPPRARPDTARARPDTAAAPAVAEPTAPTEKSAPPAKDGEAPPDVSGPWDLTNAIDFTTYPDFAGLRIRFRVRLEQHGDRITGRGTKWAVNGELLPPRQRTPIALDGSIQGRDVVLRFVEQGTRRLSNGGFRWRLSADGARMHGTFDSSAAGARGSSHARRSG
jgi:hypothetical protein